jgi:hypothetical protein
MYPVSILQEDEKTEKQDENVRVTTGRVLMVNRELYLS